jgi:hypothetical protein
MHSWRLCPIISSAVGVVKLQSSLKGSVNQEVGAHLRLRRHVSGHEGLRTDGERLREVTQEPEELHTDRRQQEKGSPSRRGVTYPPPVSGVTLETVRRGTCTSGVANRPFSR